MAINGSRNNEDQSRWTWDDFRRRVRRLPANSPKSQSYQHSLLSIADQAKAWDLDPTPLLRAHHCNLEDMIHQAKIEIEYNHPEDLQDLFPRASEMSNADFRLFCGRARRAINVGHQTFGGIEKFVIVLDPPMRKLLNT